MLIRLHVKNSETHALHASAVSGRIGKPMIDHDCPLHLWKHKSDISQIGPPDRVDESAIACRIRPGD